MNLKKIAKIINYSIEYLFLLIVFLTPIIFAFFQGNFNVFELNKLLWFRLAVSLIVVLFLIKIVLARKITVYKNNKIFILWGLLFLVFLSGVIFSLHPQLSLIGNYPRHQGFLSYAYYLLFFLFLIFNITNFGQIKKIILVSIPPSVLVCIYGIVQAYNLDPLRWQSSPGRIFSSLGQPNFLGYYLVLAIPLTIYALIFLVKKNLWRILLGLSLIIQIYSLSLTSSRGAGLGLIGGAIVFGLLCLLIKGYKKIFFSVIGVGIILFVLLITNLQAVSSIKTNINYVDRIFSSFDLSLEGSSKIRLLYWQSALEEFKTTNWRYRLFGYGIDTQEDLFIKYYRPDWALYERINSYPDRAHNLILDIWLQFGLIGLLIIASFSIYILSKAILYLKHHQTSRDKKYWLVVFLISTIAVYFISHLFGFPLTTHYVYFYLCLGLIWLIVNKKQAVIDLSVFTKYFAWTMVVFAFLFLGFIYYYFTINDFIADRHYMKAKLAEQRYDCLNILENSRQALFAFPISDFYKKEYIHFNVNCFDAVTSQEGKSNMINNVLNQIELLSPKEYQYYTWLNVAHAYSVFGKVLGQKYYDLAADNYEAVISLNTYITVNYQDYGRMELWRKNYDRARELFNKGIASVPPLDYPGFAGEHQYAVAKQVAYLDELIATSYYNQENWKKAIEYYQKSIKTDVNQIRVYRAIADSYYKLGQIDKTIEYTLLGYQEEPSDPEWSNSLSLLYKEKGDLVQAERYTKQVERLKAQIK